jgi:hypothetical protein
MLKIEIHNEKWIIYLKIYIIFYPESSCYLIRQYIPSDIVLLNNIWLHFIERRFDTENVEAFYVEQS